jgi:N-carbamoylputrescine amidase
MPQPDAWMRSIQRTVREKGVTLFLSHPERGAASGCGAVPHEESRLYNSLFVLGPEGETPAVYRKIHTTGGLEAWSSPGERPVVVDCDGVRVGLLICVDAWFPELAAALKGQGAQLLVSAAAWPPGYCGPEDTWERRSQETGLPLWVCNRTGREKGLSLDYRRAESVMAHRGRRQLAASSDRPVVLLFDWDMEAMELRSSRFQVVPTPPL